MEREPGRDRDGRQAEAVGPGAERPGPGAQGGSPTRSGRALTGACLAAAVLAAPGPPAERPSELVIAPEVQARLDVLAPALDREIVLCLLGEARGPVARVDELFMPVPHTSTPTAVVTEPCPRMTVATWHNHPTMGRSGDPAPSTDGSRSTGGRSTGRAPAPEGEAGGWSAVDGSRSCRPSTRDVTTALRLRIPFLVVADGAGNHCVYSLERLEALAG